MKSYIAAVLFFLLGGPALTQKISEPHSGMKFAVKDGDMSLLGVFCSFRA